MGFFDSWKCKVNVYLKNEVLFPGNVVEGYMQLDCSSDIDMVACRVKVTGKERTEVVRQEQEGFGDDARTVRREYHESAVVYKQLVTVAGSLKCSGRKDRINVPAGSYTYPFSFQLPNQLPPSFHKRCGDGDTASIQYYVKAYVDIPMGRDAKVKRFFRVLAGIPQQQWIARQPVSVARPFDVKLCCCIDKGTINTNFFMDRTIISVDRDNLLICVDVDNSNGQEPVESLEISLLNKLTYKARSYSDTNRERASHNFIAQRIEPGQRGRLQGVVPLPRELPATLQTFNVSCTYDVQIEINIPWASDPSVTFPVILAHAVDDSNYLPPAQFNQCTYRMIQQTPEFFYQPPPTPVYQYNPVQCAPPPGAPMYAPQPPLFNYMPPQHTWAAQIHGQQPQPQMQWGQGAPMQVTMAVQPPSPPPPLGAYGEQCDYGAANQPPQSPHTQPGSPQYQQHSQPGSPQHQDYAAQSTTEPLL